MALTWLAEAFSAAPMSPPPSHKPATAEALLTTDGAGTGLRGRRAASQRCTTIIREALMTERATSYKPRGLPALESSRGAQQPKSKPGQPKATAADGQKRSKGYSQNSRVGRAMSSIIEYIEIHQPRYELMSSNGVPERVIRQEFGNNPDTSKALRGLVQEQKIVRAGMGGRRDPFAYTIAGTLSAVRARAAAAHRMAPPLSTATPSAKGEDVELAAAAALAIPSTGKWPTTAPRRDLPRKSLQPRLSLGMVVSEDNEQLAAVSATKTGMKRPASHAFTPQTQTTSEVRLARRSTALDPSTATPTPSASAAVITGQGLADNVPPPSIAQKLPFSMPELYAATPVAGKDRLSQWPSQVPSSQRLSFSQPSPPKPTQQPSSAMTTPNGLFFIPGSSPFLAATPAVKAAYLIQLQAAQLYWQQHLAQKQRQGAFARNVVTQAIPSLAGAPATEPSQSLAREVPVPDSHI